VAVTWALRADVLVVTLEGEYSFEEPIRAVAAAMADPKFKPGTSLLIDARLSKTRRSSDEFRARSLWMASLLDGGLSCRCAIVVNSELHQYGMARMAGALLDFHGMVLEIFADMDAALNFLLTATASESSA
jgi:hypothetical protein